MGWNSAPACAAISRASGSFVVVGVVEGESEGANGFGMVARGEAEHGAGVEPAAEVAADRHVGAQADADGLLEGVAEFGGVVGVGALRRGMVGGGDS